MAFILARIITIVLLVFATKELPYDYYTILRFIVCGVSLYGAKYAYKNSKQVWIWVFGLTAVLYNPFVPFFIDKTTWVFINLLIAGMLLVSIWMPETISLRRVTVGAGLIILIIFATSWINVIHDLKKPVQSNVISIARKNPIEIANRYHGRRVIISSIVIIGFTLITLPKKKDSLGLFKVRKKDVDVSVNSKNSGEPEYKIYQSLQWIKGAYKGYTLKGIPNREGIWYSSYDQKEYMGTWKDGKFHGRGLFKYSEDKIYVGEFYRGSKNGYGSLIQLNGSQYIGEWKADEPNGQGIIKYSDGKIYIGEFVDGKRHGKGSLMYKDGKMLQGCWDFGKYIG